VRGPCLVDTWPQPAALRLLPLPVSLADPRPGGAALLRNASVAACIGMAKPFALKRSSVSTRQGAASPDGASCIHAHPTQHQLMLQHKLRACM